ncbi:MAG TPA: cyclic 2,3-diphosphoglycerate synthase [Gaiellaceae bacterium]|nr:cyclic 2,3-diphosphoglycerate synthase [Gaiellaceae bacterium]HWJ44495.1 cyclic 2,3-diphosphoglycerate synthase [Gaiellaceae bacterium]
MGRTRVLIAGAAGRDFHNFNLVYRDRPEFEVVAFTATQIPNIDGRRYPPELAGSLYPDGIPILPESALEQLVREHEIDSVVFAYSDVTHEHVMHLGSRALASGASYHLISPAHTMLTSAKPVVAVCAVRTGSGKSQTTRHVARLFRDAGKRVAVLRHPMPYGDLAAQAVQRFERYEDLEAADATIEEREEYEPHIAEGNLVFAGIDYERILRAAEEEADVILWDGGNNDTPFIKPDVHIVVVDPHRPGHELRYHPGETNLRMADVCVVNKIDSASQDGIDAVLNSIHDNTQSARVILAASPFDVEGDAEEIRGKRVLAIEDGPTLTHGEMTYGAAVLAAKQHGAAELVDPRPFAVGTIAETFEQYPNVGTLLPAMGYGRQQMEDLRETIERCDADLVLIGTPIDLRRLIELDKPAMRVTYKLQEMGEPTLKDVLAEKGLLETALV